METLLKHHETNADEAAMMVGGTHSVRGRAHAHAHGHGKPGHGRSSEPGHFDPQPAPPLPTIPGTGTGPVSKEPGGDWTPDMAKAQHDARIVLNSIDWSKHDIMIWVPGTDNHAVHPAFEAAVNESYQDGGVSLVKLVYDATWEMRPSTSTGIATLKLVLAGIAAHGGDHKVMLAGESQGAWVIGEAIADPMLRRVVDRAVLMGHPWLAAHHYEDGHDPGVVEINNPGDEIAAPVKGDLGNALDAMCAIHQWKLYKLGTIFKALKDNPEHIPMLLSWIGRSIVPGHPFKDPHNYSLHMAAAVEYLRLGTFHDGTTGSDGAAVEAARRRAKLAAALQAAHGATAAPVPAAA